MAGSETPFHTTAQIRVGHDFVTIPVTIQLPDRLSPVSFSVDQELILKPEITTCDTREGGLHLSLMECDQLYTLVVSLEAPDLSLSRLQRGNPKSLQLVTSVCLDDQDTLYGELTQTLKVDQTWFALTSDQVTYIIHRMWRHRYGLDYVAPSKSCVTLIHTVEQGQVGELKRLLPLASKDDKHKALVTACRLGQVGCVGMILGYLDPRTIDWTSVLCAVCTSNNMALFDILVSQSHDVLWASVLHDAIRSGNVDIANRCIDRVTGVCLDTCAVEAAQNGHVGILSFLYNSKDKVVTPRGWEDVLKMASKSGFLEIVALIAELSFSSEIWKEALIFAVVGGHLHLIEFILNTVKFTLDVGPALAIACEKGMVTIRDVLTQYVHKIYGSDQ